MTVGYDAEGIQKYLQENKTDVDDLAQGLYILDDDTKDNPNEVTFEILVDAGAFVGVSGLVEAGVEGGLDAKIAFDLNNPSTNVDHKYRFNDFKQIIETAPQALFDAEGEFDIFLDAFLWIGAKIGFTKITLFHDRYDFLRETLLSFHSHSTALEPPVLATREDDVLYLNTGSRAGDRKDGVGDIDEKYSVSRVTAPIAEGSEEMTDYLMVTAFGYSQGSFVDGEANLYLYPADEIKTIVVDGGAEDDAFTLGGSHTVLSQDIVLTGGSGNDSIDIYTTGTVTVAGEGGDDRITVGASNSDVTIDGDDGKDDIDVSALAAGSPVLIRTGDGNDSVQGSPRNELIFGGGHNDTIDGGGGNDIIFGGLIEDTNGDGLDMNDLPFDFDSTHGEIVAAADTLIHIPDSGNDVLLGGDGADSLFGGDDELDSAGNGGDNISGDADGDVIYGGTGNDSILGDVDESSGGADIIYAGEGNDRVRGDAGNDQLYGESGEDDLSGGLGTDIVLGGAGDDVIRWTRSLRVQQNGELVDYGDEGVDSSVDGQSGNDLLMVTGNANAELVTVSQPIVDGVHKPGAAIDFTDGTLLSFHALYVERLSIDLGSGDDHLTVDDLTTSGITDVAIDLGKQDQTLTEPEIWERFYDVSPVIASTNDLLSQSTFALLDVGGMPATAEITNLTVSSGNQAYQLSDNGASGSMMLTVAGNNLGVLLSHDADADAVAASFSRLVTPNATITVLTPSDASTDEVRNVSLHGRVG